MYNNFFYISGNKSGAKYFRPFENISFSTFVVSYKQNRKSSMELQNRLRMFFFSVAFCQAYKMCTPRENCREEERT